MIGIDKFHLNPTRAILHVDLWEYEHLRGGSNWELKGGVSSESSTMASNPKKLIDLNTRGRVAYRLREVSDMTGIPVITLRTMARRGDLNPITSFGTWLIAAEELEALLNKRLRNGR